MPAGWPFATGQDHLPNHALAAIDYAGIHLWPDVWSRDDREWGLRWIRAHADNAALLGKPLVVEEFGKFVGAHFHARLLAKSLSFSLFYVVLIDRPALHHYRRTETVHVSAHARAWSNTQQL